MESLRSQDRLRWGLTLAGVLLATGLGYGLWTGSANPITYLNENKQRASREATATRLVALRPPNITRATLKDQDEHITLVRFDSTNPDTPVEALLFDTEDLPTRDHTLLWQKRGYTVLPLSEVYTDKDAPAQCELVSAPRGARGSFYRLSYYLTANKYTSDYQTLVYHLLQEKISGRHRPQWALRIEMQLQTDCRKSGSLLSARRFNAAVQGPLSRL